MAYMIKVNPQREINLLSCRDGGLTGDEVRELVGERYTVVPTRALDLVMILYGDNTEENELATDIMNDQPVAGCALIARVRQGKIAGMALERAGRLMQKLEG